MSSPIAADFSDRSDFANAHRGFPATLKPMVIKTSDGRVIWDMDSRGFLAADCPDTANPSLWRQGQLTAKHGLYEVADGIYQVRGFDTSNMTMVESRRPPAAGPASRSRTRLRTPAKSRPRRPLTGRRRRTRRRGDQGRSRQRRAIHSLRHPA
jgi:hypothetical protein